MRAALRSHLDDRAVEKLDALVGEETCFAHAMVLRACEAIRRRSLLCRPRHRVRRYRTHTRVDNGIRRVRVASAATRASARPGPAPRALPRGFRAAARRRGATRRA